MCMSMDWASVNATSNELEGPSSDHTKHVMTLSTPCNVLKLASTKMKPTLFFVDLANPCTWLVEAIK